MLSSPVSRLLTGSSSADAHSCQLVWFCPRRKIVISTVRLLQAVNQSFFFAFETGYLRIIQLEREGDREIERERDRETIPS